jgi:hypothetical protein
MERDVGDVSKELISDAASSPLCQALEAYAKHKIMQLDGFGKA